MSNHPISFISSFQMAQTSMSRNAESLTPATPALPSTGSAGSSAASVSGAGAAATDVHVMQASDATSFIYGTTASNKSATTSDYTTVDDAAKLANRVATDNDVIEKIKREEQRRKKQKKSTAGTVLTKENPEELTNNAPAPENHYLQNTMMVASHGVV